MLFDRSVLVYISRYMRACVRVVCIYSYSFVQYIVSVGVGKTTH